MSSDSTKRFSDRVENYVKYRPNYPAEAYSFLKEKFELSEKSLVADVGSGTGISTGPLLKFGCTVYAVEPNAEMRGAAEKEFSGFKNFKSVDGTAENTGLAEHSLDLALAAQAFHWFEPVKTRKEFVRILKPDHFAVIMWNNRQDTGTPFLEGYEKLLQTYGTDYNQVKRQNVMHNGAMEAFFVNGCEMVAFPNGQALDYESLKGRLLSSSYAPNESHPNHVPMLRELRELFDKYSGGGRVEIPYETNLYFARLGQF